MTFMSVWKLLVQIAIPFDVLTIYLGTIALNIQSTADKYLMRMLLVGGKKGLSRKWLQADASS